MGVDAGTPRLEGPIALLFPGQGVQRPGMGRRLHDRYAAARGVFERAESVLDMPVRRLCFDGPAEELNRTDVLQPCVMTVCWAAYEVYREIHGTAGVEVMAGHSLGEFGALAASGSISWEDSLPLVRERGVIMARATEDTPGGMIAIVGLDEFAIESIRTGASAHGRLWVANRNSEVQFVLSGEVGAVEEAERLAIAAGARRALILTIPLPAHSPLMEHASADFARVLGELRVREPDLPVLSNAAGVAMTTVEAIRAELEGHLLRPVDWARTMGTMQAMNIRTFVELGPGRVLASLAAKHIPGAETWNAEELLIDFAVSA